MKPPHSTQGSAAAVCAESSGSVACCWLLSLPQPPLRRHPFCRPAPRAPPPARAPSPEMLRGWLDREPGAVRREKKRTRTRRSRTVDATRAEVKRPRRPHSAPRVQQQPARSNFDPKPQPRLGSSWWRSQPRSQRKESRARAAVLRRARRERNLGDHTAPPACSSSRREATSIPSRNHDWAPAGGGPSRDLRGKSRELALLCSDARGGGENHQARSVEALGASAPRQAMDLQRHTMVVGLAHARAGGRMRHGGAARCGQPRPRSARQPSRQHGTDRSCIARESVVSRSMKNAPRLSLTLTGRAGDAARQ